ncbi:sulfite exporter TauE/SafE family protein [Acrocarpospora corrugata]|uniref:sulfite exporter TauE/SafE family protein n=1 Tax=Acrocarpospora corrugata TaxID=35763 RepID=UPI001FEAAF00|nr:sulfite exporter TauE/SafE family protein [Acrocarpospora corrugata]
MVIGEFLGLAAAGVLAGLLSTVVSIASIASYPALLAIGLPPLAANVTNTFALLFTGLGAAAGSRPELSGQGPLLRRLGVAAALGGAAGAALLLVTPPRVFEYVAPVLIAAAALLLLRAPHPRPRAGLAVHLSVFAVAVYTGYFGAAGGVIMFAVLTAALDQLPARVNAVKNVLGLFANAVAALGFALFGPVDWSAALPLALGLLLGGRLGPPVVRRLPGQSLRLLAAGCGLLVAAVLGYQTYV